MIIEPAPDERHPSGAVNETIAVPETTAARTIRAARERLTEFDAWADEPHTGDVTGWYAYYAGAFSVAVRTLLDLAGKMRDSACLMPCDLDCEVGPVHCGWIHEPSHKPGWHASEDCPFAFLREDTGAGT